MLHSLSIRDVVLIERLDVQFDDGLCVLTGETGAGKSILLDALGLALGMRAEARLVRAGAERASVTAAFDPPAEGAVHAILDAHGLGGEDSVTLRRVVSADGRSKAYINDQPASVGLLRTIGAALVEVHGQFETQGLLNPAGHRALLDAFAANAPDRAGARNAFAAWKAAVTARQEAETRLEAARREEDFLRHAVDELAALDPKPGEERDLAERRAMMQNAEKLAEALNGAAGELSAGHGVEAALRGALRRLERVADKLEGRLDGAIAAFDRAAVDVGEGMAQLERVSGEIDLDPRHLEAAEERLFALRAAARKHGVEVDGLCALADDFRAQLDALEDGGGALERLRATEAEARAGFEAAAERLSASRRAAASRLDTAVAAELAPLKLEKARFETAVETLPADRWSADGRDRVAFQVATNPGAAPGPLDRIASGGELARFMLALKVVLAKADPVPTLVFDEVDAGIGGAVAAAVGDRLARLGADVQVLVVTHSPQVAARGAGHWQVSKSAAGEGVATTVRRLDDGQRREEIARMLAGAEVTEEARAAAATLLEGRVA